MNKQFFSNLFVSAVAVLMLFFAASCNNMIELNNGQGSLSVALPGGRSASGVTYTVDLISSSGDTHNRTAAAGQVVQFSGLYPDAYSIEVSGLDTSDAVVLYGTSDVIVKARESSFASVELTEVVTTIEHLQKAISEGGVVCIGSDIEISQSLEIPSSVKVEIQAAYQDVVLSSSGGNSIFNVTGGTLTLGGGKHLLTLDGKNKGGEGLYVNGGNAYLKDNGRIINHSGSNVHIDRGTFELVGGTITRTIESTGRGVNISGGTFNMRSGAIVGHTSNDQGGGVFLNGGTLNMSGGTISGNTATTNGGGVSYNGGTFDMTGGTISGNKVTNGSGNGIYLGGSNFSMSGSVLVDSNNDVYLTENRTITIDGKLQKSYVATITPASYDQNKDVLVAGAGMQLDADDYDKFLVTPHASSKYKIHNVAGKGQLLYLSSPSS